MNLRRLALVDVRSYRTLEWRPAPGLNLIVGANGSGKTNLLEAIALTAGMRLRPLVREADLVRHGAEAMRIAADFEADAPTDGGSHEVTFQLAGRSRRYLRDGNPARPGQEGMPSLVAFTPDDLDVVKGGPEARRHLLERDMAQLSVTYRDLLRRYNRALAQRNALLRAMAAGASGDAELTTWDEAVAGLGAAVQRWRAAAVSALAPRVAQTYDSLAGAPSAMVLSYRPRLALDDPGAGRPSPPPPAGDAHADAARLLAALRNARPAEVARGYTLVGPHRDDLGFELAGSEMRGIASQGEQRTAVVAVKLALLGHLAEGRADRPLLALDDVLSELDEMRQDRLMQAAKGYQTFVTTAASVPGLRAQVWRAGGGGLSEWRAGA